MNMIKLLILTAVAVLNLPLPFASAKEKERDRTTETQIQSKAAPSRTPKPMPDASSPKRQKQQAPAQPQDSPCPGCLDSHSPAETKHKSIASERREKDLRATIQTNQSLRHEMLNAAKSNDLTAAKASLTKAGFKDVQQVQISRFHSTIKVCVVFPDGSTHCIKMTETD